MLIGYARVSTDQQQTNLQIDALLRAGCDVVHQEKASGGSMNRPVLLAMLGALNNGDTVIVYKLDRMGRSLADLLDIARRVEARGARLQSLTDCFETATAAGRMMFQLLGTFAEFERSMIVERTSAGLAAARARGKVLGRPSPIEQHAAEVLHLWRSGGWTKTSLARKFGTHISSVKRLLKRHSAQAGRCAG